MTLIKCPNCGHTISSVASKCPRCGNQLSQFRFVQGEGGGLTECRRCARKVLSGAKICPYCGVSHPGRRSPVVLLTLGIALVLPVLVLATLRNRSPEPPVLIPARTGEDLPAAVAPAPRLQAAPGPAAPRAPVVAPAAGVMGDNAGGVSTQTKWTLDWANVRQGRALEAPVVRVLRPGAPVQVSDRQLGWWALYLDGRMAGYVAGSVLGDRPPVLARPDTAGHE